MPGLEHREHGEDEVGVMTKYDFEEKKFGWRAHGDGLERMEEKKNARQISWTRNLRCWALMVQRSTVDDQKIDQGLRR
jgi:hypothetical protein